MNATGAGTTQVSRLGHFLLPIQKEMNRRPYKLAALKERQSEVFAQYWLRFRKLKLFAKLEDSIRLLLTRHLVKRNMRYCPRFFRLSWSVDLKS